AFNAPPCKMSVNPKRGQAMSLAMMALKALKVSEDAGSAPDSGAVKSELNQTQREAKRLPR
ncbi:MAG: hypothetical protein ACRCVX_13260, partial [Shewanella sp.]